MQTTPVLLFDGECGLCNGTVRFMMKRDRSGVLRYAPLQGKTGQALLARHGLERTDFESLVFVRDLDDAGAGFSRRSDGALEALEQLGGGWPRLARIARCIPPAWRDGLYKLVARSRYRLFGPWRPRPFDKPEWARRVLD